MRHWLPLGILSAASFIMVLDTTVMNVAITQVVEDLDTTVQAMQAAITLYTLVMAAFMLVGAKLGDMFGRKQIFLVGLGIYGCGSLITAIAPNMTTLYIGWSGIEGIGAVLVIPAIAALVIGNYEGADRALAYGVLGGVMAAGAAAGPLIGGWMTTYASWRYVFAGEVVLVIVVILLQRFLIAPPIADRRPKLDVGGGLLSAAGLGLVVIGILQSSSWGWLLPRGAMTVGGHEITPFGLSMVPFFIAVGAILITAFAHLQQRRSEQGKDILLDVGLLKVPQMRAGLTSLVGQQILIMGLFFVIPLFLQIVVGLDAFETGLRIMPMSLSMLVAALSGPRLAAKRSPRLIVWIGLTLITVGCFLLVDVVEVELDSGAFMFATCLFGLGAGLLASQLGNVIMSSVDRSRSSEAGGLQGTAQNLGSSLGTALIGSVLIASLTTGLYAGLQSNPAVPEASRTAIEQATQSGVPIVSLDDATDALTEAGLPAGEVEAVVDEYSSTQLAALKKALGALAVLAVGCFWLTRNLPRQPMA